MKKLTIKIKRYSHATYRILMFLVAIFLISNLLPREGKFKFEFKKGEPWRYDMLIAPFDFRIFKDDAQLSAEQDSIIKNFRPYFYADTSVYRMVRTNVVKNIEAQSSLWLQKYPFLNLKKHGVTLLDEMIPVMDSVLQEVYLKGVVRIPDEYLSHSKHLEVMVIDNNLAEPFSISEFNTLRLAYQISHNKLIAALKSNGINDAMAANFVSDLKLNAFIEPNIVFDADRTQLEQDGVLKNISLTEGIVLSGQKIIDKGELIDEIALKKLVSYKKEYENRIGTMSEHNIIYAGQIIVTFILVMSLFLFLYLYRRDVYENLKHITFLLVILAVVIVLAFISYSVPDIPVWVIPFTILPLVVRTFLDSRLAFFFYVIAILLASFFSDNSFDFILMQIPAGVAAIFTLYKMARRSQIVRSAIAIFFLYCALYTGLTLLQDGGISGLNYEMYTFFAINGLLVLMVYPLIYVFEKLFGFLSDVTLVELSDTNHPLLRQLAERAPGTFQHSIQVGNLAQEAAYKIDANPLLIRAGAMYHDIGKTSNPYYFTENQTSGINPHQSMDYEESAKIVIDHIEGGVKIARKHKLPQKIIDFITTHQGTTKTRYFYNSFINENPEVEPNEAHFTYPGPTPFSKETAILMMADSVEAASRSLKEYTDEAIDGLVEKIIDAQIRENQFYNAPITFREITKVKEVFKEKLKNIYHARVSYPTLNKEQEKKK